MFLLNVNLICVLRTVSALLVRWPGIQKQAPCPREGRAIIWHKMEGSIFFVVVVISENNIGVTNLVDSWNIYYLKQDPNIRRKAVQNRGVAGPLKLWDSADKRGLPGDMRV